MFSVFFSSVVGRKIVTTLDDLCFTCTVMSLSNFGLFSRLDQWSTCSIPMFCLLSLLC